MVRFIINIKKLNSQSNQSLIRHLYRVLHIVHNTNLTFSIKIWRKLKAYIIHQIIIDKQIPVAIFCLDGELSCVSKWKCCGDPGVPKTIQKYIFLPHSK